MRTEIEKSFQIEPELNSVDLYLNQIQRYPKEGLGPEREHFLFGCLKSGLPMDYLLQSNFLESIPNALRERYRDAMTDSQNIEQFIELCNLALPISIAKKTARRFHDNALLLDFIQAGNEGLTIAVKTYDFERKEHVRFSTYASAVIKNKIWEFIGIVKHPISIADNIRTVLNKASHFRENFYQEHGRLPNDDEAREALLTLGVSNSKINAAFNALRMGVTNQPGELPTKAHGFTQGETAREVVLVDQNVHVEEKALNNVFEEEFLRKITDILTSTQLTVFLLNQGLSGYPPLEPIEIAKIRGVSPQRVSELLRRANKKLSEVADLREFIAA